MTAPRRVRLRRALLAGVALCYAGSIPWYREGGDGAAVFWGLPDWVAVALGCYAAAAVLNAAAWLLTDVPDAEPEPPPDPAGGP